MDKHLQSQVNLKVTPLELFFEGEWGYLSIFMFYNLILSSVICVVFLSSIKFQAAVFQFFSSKHHYIFPIYNVIYFLWQHNYHFQHFS